jgi:hypothetical protein
LSFNVFFDVYGFVTGHKPKNLGMFPDAFTIWNFAAPTPGSGQEDVAWFISPKKDGRTPKESNLMASLKLDSPPILFGTMTDPGCGKLVAKTKGFGANLDTFKGYDETSTSMRSTLQKYHDVWLASSTSNLDYNDPVQRLSKAMCKLGHSLNKPFLDAITNLFQTFHVVCQYSAPEAWLLVRCAGRHVWIHLKMIRAKTMGIDDISTPPARATIIWTMLQSLTALKEILDVGMQCHPNIMKEIMQFQLEHRVDETQLKAVEALVDRLKMQVKECNAATVKAEKITATLSHRRSETLRIK